MNKFYTETLYKLETEINDLEIEADHSIQRIEAVIGIILKCLSEVKKYVLNRGFKNIGEEIHFFKYQKPTIVSKLIYSPDRNNVIAIQDQTLAQAYKIEFEEMWGSNTLTPNCKSSAKSRHYLLKFSKKRITFNYGNT